MKRLFWKEANEQIWIFLAALALPLVVLMYLRVFVNRDGVWPRESSDLWLVYCIFAFWGATRMPHEREGGRLTLAALPLRVWQVWLLKGLPGMVGAGFCVWIAYGAGYAPGRFGPLRVPYSFAPSEAAGELALAYSAAFLVSLFWSAGVSGVIGTAASIIGWGVYWGTVRHTNSRDPGATWLVVAALLLVSFCVALARSRGASPRRVGIVVIALCAAAVGAGVIPPLLTGTAESSVWLYPRPAVVLSSRPNGLVAFVTLASQPISSRGRAVQGLWAMRRDGSGRRLVAEATCLVPLAWADGGQLVYLEWQSGGSVIGIERDSGLLRVRGARRPMAHLMVWDSKTGKGRVLNSVPSAYLLLQYLSEVAVEPGGNRVAVTLPADQGPGVRFARDLWLFDLQAGEKRLLWPNTSPRELLWRAGRIYLRFGNRWTNSISPDGGRPRKETGLPIGKGGDWR